MWINKIVALIYEKSEPVNGLGQLVAFDGPVVYWGKVVLPASVREGREGYLYFTAIRQVRKGIWWEYCQRSPRVLADLLRCFASLRCSRMASVTTILGRPLFLEGCSIDMSSYKRPDERSNKSWAMARGWDYSREKLDAHIPNG